MKHLLQDGQRFRCAEFQRASMKIAHKPKMHPDPTRLRIDDRGGNKVWLGISATEATDIGVSDKATIGSMIWTVIKTTRGGGGTGHGPHDIYEDTHQVTARDDNGREISFTQGSGSYCNEIKPEQIELTGGPPDEPGFYRAPTIRADE